MNHRIRSGVIALVLLANALFARAPAMAQTAPSTGSKPSGSSGTASSGNASSGNASSSGNATSSGNANGTGTASSSGEEARAEFMRGTALVTEARWAEALAAFERAAALRPHPITTHNIGACERAMGRYTRAYRTFARALEENRLTDEKALPASLATEAKGYLAEIDRLLVRLTLDVTPAGARVTVDGRPLEAATNARGELEYVGGIRPPGTGDLIPQGAFVVVLDPGVHVLTFARPGFEDAIVHRTLSPGKSIAQKIELTELPASIHVSSNRPGAIVRVSGMDVGPTPVDVLRPAGDYAVVVRKEGFQPYEARLRLRAGQETDLRVSLVEDKRSSIFERWWFWTAAGVLVTGAVVGIVAATYPGPREPVGTGTLGWGTNVP
ncbi:PEGA domain-containing protein [Pendulispora albinea]|uniref:PEGA domain-containing protein n=1 Tax=Pendulispora albinea TaxID=2741071 RepID=A0ABZ2MC66_9BACT